MLYCLVTSLIVSTHVCLLPQASTTCVWARARRLRCTYGLVTLLIVSTHVCLLPAGEYNLRLGVMKELHPDLIATHQGDVRVFEGHAFIVEAAVSVGGRDIKQGER